MTEDSGQRKSTTTDSQPTALPGKWRRRFKRYGAVSLVAIVILAVLVVGAEYYTSRPGFSGSCHIMGPYYKGWDNDIHSSNENAVACVDCHYRPGQQHTIKAKFKGMSQLMSYFSGRAGAKRPKAHVADASCLASDCHGNQEFMTKELRLNNVTFTHAKHLDSKEQTLVAAQQELKILHGELSKKLNPNQLAAIDTIAQELTHAHQRNIQLASWLDERGFSAIKNKVTKYAELLHADLRIDQLKGLKCASCHQFDPSIEKHFIADKAVCYTCHFMNQPYNSNTGRCMSCHEPPTNQVPVHAKPKPGDKKSRVLGMTEVTMNHALIVSNKVDCNACHSDLIHGTGKVTRRDCQNCHDQESFLKDFDRLTIEVVRDYHRVHAADQRARCNDCHRLIEHKLITLDGDDSENLLGPVRQDCEHCHPSHHREQVELLVGHGGFIQQEGVPNVMVGSRINCCACHTQGGGDNTCDSVITNTVTSCRGCHSEEYEQLFTHWQKTITARLEESRLLLDTVQKKIEKSKNIPDKDLSQPSQLYTRAQNNIKLVDNANGAHNKNYALMLLDQAIRDLEKASKLLTE